MWKFILLLPLFLLLTSSISVSAPSEDIVSSLLYWPDFTENNIKMYSGYLSTNSSNKSNSDGSIHYIFMESLGNSSKDPVILWLNGGPGCSSLFGLFQEIGPYLIAGNTSVKNEYTWLKNASILVFESPFGVGFSYNTTKIKYTENDTALYNYYALLNWLQKFESFKNLDFWIAGESYAGMYIPYLSSMILNNTKNNGINFKGIMVGNGVLLSDQDFNSQVFLDFYVKHNMLSPQLVKILKAVCPNDPTSISCQYAKQQTSSLLTKVNPYDIYGYCNYLSSESAAAKPLPYSINFLTVEENNVDADSTNVLPCVSSQDLTDYLNLKTVQDSLHITKAFNDWQDCSATINQAYQRGPSGSLWIYPLLFKAGIKILLFSGDTDSVVSYLNTEMALNQLGLTVINGWRNWKTSDGQVGGYVTRYKELTFTTIRGSGHMVPQAKPMAAYHMFERFLNGTEF